MSGAKSCHPFSVESLLGLSKTIQETAQEQKEKKTEPQAQLHNYDLNHQTLSGYAEDKREQPNSLTFDDANRKRRQRVLFNENQIHILKSVFARQKYLSPEARKNLADSLNLSTKQVKTWFQNYRYKCRRKANTQLRWSYEEKEQKLRNSSILESTFRLPMAPHFTNDVTDIWEPKPNRELISSLGRNFPYHFPYTNNLHLIHQ